MNVNSQTGSKPTATGMKWWMGWTLLAASWLTALNLFPGDLMAIPLIALSVAPFVGRKPKIALLSLLSPVAVLFFLGTASWFDDRPALRFMGLPSYAADNLDRDTRCFHATGGCVIRGGEDLLQGAHNLGLKTLVTVFGWPPKTYRGPFPTQEESVALLASKGTRMSPAEFSKGRFVAGTNQLVLEPRFVEMLTRDLGEFFSLVDDESPLLFAEFVNFEDSCWIIRLSSIERKEPWPFPKSDCIYLMDGKSGDAFARYAQEGRPRQFSSVLHGRWRGRER